MGKEEENQVIFTDEDGEEIAFYVMEQTRINGNNYLLVADSLEDEEEGEALILRETKTLENGELVYDIVEDDTELAAISKVFGELLEDVDLL